MFSATFPDELVELTTQFMFNPNDCWLNDTIDLGRISQYYINVKHNHWKYDVLTDIYNTIQIAQCIIYINSKSSQSDLLSVDQRKLSRGNDSRWFDDPTLCDDTINQFRQGEKIRILLSTDLLSRGIDIQQLSLVINYDLPIQKEPISIVSVVRVGMGVRAWPSTL